MAGQELTASLRDLLEEIAASEGFKTPRLSIGDGTKRGDNFLGEILRVVVEEQDNNAQKRCLSLIIKIQPRNELRRKLYRSSSFFSNEAFFYNDVIPTFLDFQREKGITTTPSPPHPRCLLAGDLLILEDQQPLGFIMRDRLETLDSAHCLLIMRELGRLHALSFALRDQRPTLFQRLSAGITETLLPPGGIPALKVLIAQSALRGLEKFKESPKHREGKYIDALKDFSVGFYEKLEQAAGSRDAEPYAVICHGDCWTNNLLFKYEEGKQEPERVVFLDFQLSRFASPACDLSYFLYCCTDGATRREHYTQFLQEYHSSLAVHLARLGSDVTKLFPMEALQDQMKRFGKFGIGFALAFIPGFTCNAEEVPDLDLACQESGEKLAETFAFTHSNDKICWERVYDAVADAVNYGYSFN